MDWMEQHPEKISSRNISLNPNITELIERVEIRHTIDWRDLSTNPTAIGLIEQNQDKIVWECLSQNKNAMHLIKQHKNRIDWKRLSRNPNIFVYDYGLIKETFAEKNQCVTEYIHHPRFVQQFLKDHTIEELDNAEGYLDWFNSRK